MREWAMFVSLGLIWGSSFLWIKLALAGDGHDGFAPLLLVAGRVLLGVVGLGVLMWARGMRVPTDRATLRSCAVIGLTNTAIPFALITWGETRIPSGVASILNGTVPLFAIVIAHFTLHDEPITRARMAGMLAGFAGVVVLVSRSLGAGAGNVLGQAAVVGAAVSYAWSATYTRRHLRGLSPLVQAFTTLSFASCLLVPAVVVLEGSLSLPARPIAWLGLVWLGLLGSCAAYLLSFSLIRAWGATRATMVTYVFPVVGLLLGILVLGEPTDWRLFVGTGMVISGILVVNARAIAQALPSRRTAVP